MVELTLPDRESYVSSVSINDSQLSVRLVCDYHPGTNQRAFTVVAHKLEETAETIRFLEECKDNQAYVYMQQDRETVTFSTEAGRELRIRAQHMTSNPCALNETELAESLSRVWAWYLSESQARHRNAEKIETARAILIEAKRRIEIKSEPHSQGTAAVLYSQQLSLIQRLIETLGT